MLISGFFIPFWNSFIPLNLAALQKYACDIQHCWPIQNIEPKLSCILYHCCPVNLDWKR